jgi:hypothetical protein
MRAEDIEDEARPFSVGSLGFPLNVVPVEEPLVIDDKTLEELMWV